MCPLGIDVSVVCHGTCGNEPFGRSHCSFVASVGIGVGNSQPQAVVLITGHRGVGGCGSVLDEIPGVVFHGAFPYPSLIGDTTVGVVQHRREGDPDPWCRCG